MAGGNGGGGARRAGGFWGSPSFAPTVCDRLSVGPYARNFFFFFVSPFSSFRFSLWYASVLFFSAEVELLR